MPTKVSEKKLFVSIIFLTGAVFLFFTAKVIAAPVLISEKGLFAVMAAIVLLIIAVRVFSRSIQKF